jgi:hypothetical protein
MPRIEYIKPKKFHNATLNTIAICNEILEDYTQQGFDISLRQLYYQMVSRGYIPNTDKSYKNLGEMVNDARLAGLMDWDHIIDRTRNLRGLGHFDSPADIIAATSHSYNVDMWEGQQFRPEVWVEKDALVGIVQRAANQYDTPYFSCRGYTSSSAMWRTAQRLLGYKQSGQTPVIIHLGDHDPSGIDMTRDISDRLDLFMGGVEIKRIALNMDQVTRFNPPPNPAKVTDSRCEKYIEEYGHESWELDALEPSVLTGLIGNTINSLIDRGPWDECAVKEAKGRAVLQGCVDNWEDIEWYINHKAA